MPHYKTMYDDKDHLYAFDLQGRDVTLIIERVFAGVIEGEKGRKSKKPTIKFEGKDKKLAINKTNGKIISRLYGTDTDNWIGKAITIYPTTTEFGGETVECIRIRPAQPEAKSRGPQRPNGQRPPNGQQPAPHRPVTAQTAMPDASPTDEEIAEIARLEAEQADR